MSNKAGSPKLHVGPKLEICYRAPSLEAIIKKPICSFKYDAMFLIPCAISAKIYVLYL